MRQFVVLIAVADFNSHAHVERDPLKYQHSVRRQISTHTLTWSVTHFPFDILISK